MNELISKNTYLTKQQRIISLDTLRGLAIFGMILSGLIPRTLPGWMYHAQVPPPEFKFNPDVPGITWVDLVFPFFLFSMGAAIPIALTKRIERNEPMWRIIGHIVYRWLVLSSFAIYLGNSNVWAISNSPKPILWLRSLLGFFCWILVLVRLPVPKNINARKPIWLSLKYLARMVGVIGIILLMYTVRWKDGSGFDKSRRDIIIMLLAFSYTVGSFMWLATRNSLLPRLSLIAGVFALRLHNAAGGAIVSTLEGWIKPVRWLFSPSWIQLTLVVIPGTIIGDLFLQWIKNREKEQIRNVSDLGLTNVEIFAVIFSLLAVTIGGLVFLYTSIRLVISGLVFTLLFCSLAYSILHRTKQSSASELLKNLMAWSIFLLIIGYILEPFEGGIKKDPATPSYYFVTVGMAIALLIVFVILLDILKKGERIGFLRTVGSNPLLAYFTGSGFVYPILHLTHLINPIDNLVANNTIAGTVWAILLTFIVTTVVYIFTRLKVYIRV